jgi:polyisoprenoid-binding protein YceI
MCYNSNHYNTIQEDTMSTATISQADTTVSTWQIDPAHTQVEFEVAHLMFAKVRGRFRTVEGALHLGSGPTIGASSASVVIASASIDTAQTDRDAHLRSADFFDVERFPELRFESRSVVRRGPGALTVNGDLVIRDVTRAVSLDVRESGAGKDPWGNDRIAFTATTTIDRREFGLTWNQALETGGILVGNDVRITIDLQAVKAAA